MYIMSIFYTSPRIYCLRVLPSYAPASIKELV